MTYTSHEKNAEAFQIMSGCKTINDLYITIIA
jgi:hypothetical protein